MRQQHGGGHVADNLARAHAHQKRAVSHEPREQAFHRGNARHVAREYEEAREGEQQPVVHGAQSAPVEHGEREHDGRDRRRIGHEPEHRRDDKREQRDVGDGSQAQASGTRRGTG